MLKSLPLTFVLLPLVVGCEPALEPPCGVPDSSVTWSHVAVGRDGDRIRVRGFDLSLPQGSRLEVRDGDSSVASAEPDPRGRFDLSFVSSSSSVELVVSADGWDKEERLDFAVKAMAQARLDAVQGRLCQTGAVPNHIALVPDLAAEGDVPLLMVNSGDNTVDNIGLDSAERRFPALSLADRQGPSGAMAANPYAVVVMGELAAVSKLLHSGVTLFEISTGRIIGEVHESAAVPLPSPFVPEVPVDGDGDGALETEVLSLLPRTLQGLAASETRLFVSAANLLRPASPAVFGPGMVLVYDWDASGLRPSEPAYFFTAFDNPGSVAVHDGKLLVVETGALMPGVGGWQAGSDGGVEIFDVETLEQLSLIELDRSAPGSAALSADGAHLYVGSLLEPSLSKVELSTGQVLRGPANPIRLFESDQTQSIFSLLAHPMGLVLASNFNSDQLYVVDMVEDAVLPWPFASPFKVGEGGQAFAGAHAMVLRQGRNGVDFCGADVAVLMSLAARVVTVNTRHVMGP